MARSTAVFCILLTLFLILFPVSAAGLQEDAATGDGILLDWSGTPEPGQSLTFFTVPELPDTLYAVRPEAGDWIVLEGAVWQIPADLAFPCLLEVRSFSDGQPCGNTLTLTLVSGPSGETEPTSVPAETEPEEPEPPEETSSPTEPAEESAPTEPPAGPGLYFGRLHSHSDLSSGSLPVQDLCLSARDSGLDFFAVTDHAHSFDADGSDWAAGSAAAQTASGGRFAALWGQEMSWAAQLQTGHIALFQAPGFATWETPEFSDPDFGLDRYYETISGLHDAVGQFCHPGAQYGTFRNFRFCSAADDVMALLEVPCLSIDSIPFPCDYYYIMALDAGWHVAPAGSQAYPEHMPGWTAVYATALTESGICEALRSRRCYATGDEDLQIQFSLSGQPMGSRLKRRHIGQSAMISFSLFDPTDASLGLAEIVTEGGVVLWSEILTGNSADATLSLPGEYAYFYLRLTQPDGQMALTAPVWVDQQEDLGISSMECACDVVECDVPFTLDIQLHNGEDVDFSVESVTLSGQDTLLLQQTSVLTVPAGKTYTHSVTLTCSAPGITRITAVVSGTLEGSPRTYEAQVDISVHQSHLVTGISFDGSHLNQGLDRLTNLKALAEQSAIRVTVCQETPEPDDLKDCRLMVVTAPEEPFSDAFLSAMSVFAGWGGSLLICGPDDGITGISQLNRLLAAVGATAELSPASDGAIGPLLSSRFASQDPLCQNLAAGMVYRQSGSCTLRPGNGSILVASPEGTSALLVRETLSAGGSVFTAAGLFLSDVHTGQPESIWDLPYANRQLMRALLRLAGQELPLSTIEQARQHTSGDALRIRGYVTAGTANPHNRFPDMLYLQDDTGGIAVSPVTRTDLAVGTPLEVVGYLSEQKGNPTLIPDSLEILPYDFYRYTGIQGDWDQILDPARYGGCLIRIEGTCTETMKDSDDTLREITLKNSSGHTARVLIEAQIGSTASGENNLHKTILPDRTVRALGILHVDDAGDPVLRVRNCEEVVSVPPPSSLNPKTSDPFAGFFSCFLPHTP